MSIKILVVQETRSYWDVSNSYLLDPPLQDILEKRLMLTLFSLGGGGHIVPALTLTNYNF